MFDISRSGFIENVIFFSLFLTLFSSPRFPRTALYFLFSTSLLVISSRMLNICELTGSCETIGMWQGCVFPNNISIFSLNWVILSFPFFSYFPISHRFIRCLEKIGGRRNFLILAKYSWFSSLFFIYFIKISIAIESKM